VSTIDPKSFSTQKPVLAELDADLGTNPEYTQKLLYQIMFADLAVEFN
jgi:hypothetical protein